MWKIVKKFEEKQYTKYKYCYLLYILLRYYFRN